MMTLLDGFAREMKALGYREDALRWDYAYSDVWSAAGSARSVPFAVFSQTPPSYRSAAFAVVEAAQGNSATVVHAHRALGAPVFFAIEEQGISVWQAYADKYPRSIGYFEIDDLHRYFSARRNDWAPDRMHRAKSIGRVVEAYQLSFVDIGLIPAIEGETHLKLDRLIRHALAGTSGVRRDDAVRSLFRGVFRLLAAKILMDRGHSRSQTWEVDDVGSVLRAVGTYYSLGNVKEAWPQTALTELAPVWEAFRAGFNVANISADDLAYVYESTLVTKTARAEFGTHSTPRHIADYVVERLRLWEFGETPPRVYEPFTGAGVFLGSALRHMRDALPHEWTDQRRHTVLTERIGGAEFDPFAVEVAKLSLILADYPFANGWQIEEADLFEAGALERRMEGAGVILCNPPFEAFDARQRMIYAESSEVSRSKAVFALETALRAAPDMLGFVVPNTLLVNRRYRTQRQQIERLYREVEMVALPDRIFKVSQADTALLIARDRLRLGERRRVRSARVLDHDRRLFAETGEPSWTQENGDHESFGGEGNLWLTPLRSVWSVLDNRPRLGSVLHGHWGLRWKRGQKGRAHRSSGPGRSPGFMNSSELHQFVLGTPLWLDTDPEDLFAGGNLSWSEPKILCNAGRLSRGHWQLAAAVGQSGLTASQQFIALWPQKSCRELDLDAMAAVINAPIVNAFLTERTFDKRFRIKTLAEAPIPVEMPAGLGDLSRSYSALARSGRAHPGELDRLLREIDAIVLRAYALSPSYEQAVLSVMENHGRPLVDQPTNRRRTRGSTRRAVEGTSGPGPLFETSAISVGEGLGEECSLDEGMAALMAYAKPVPLAEWAGEAVTGPELQRRLGVGEADLSDWRIDGAVIVLDGENGEPLFPLEQFEAGQPVGGLAGVLDKVGSIRVAWSWLRQPHGDFDLRRPIDILRAGRTREVIRAAARDFR